MFCCQMNDLDARSGIEYHSTPLKVKLLQGLGLRSFAINKFVFARPQPKYQFVKKEGFMTILINGSGHLPPIDYNQTCHLLNNKTASIPVVRLTPKSKPTKSVIVFSHGNGSDLSHSLYFISSLATMHHAQYVAYDYSGYGVSGMKNTTPHTICSDLEAVLAWVDRPLNEVILVGFSLGCFPTAKIASRYKVKAVILFSPMMSLISLMADEHKLGINSFFKNDELNTFEVIENIQSNLLLIHSKHDDLIPFRHSDLIYQRYVKLSKNRQVRLMEVENLGHNQVLTYIQYIKDNQVQLQFLAHLNCIERSEPAHLEIQRKNRKQMIKKRQQMGMQWTEEQFQKKKKEGQKISIIQLQQIRNSFINP